MEAEVISTFFPDLVTAVCDDVHSLSEHCLSKGLITDSVHREVHESGGDRKYKARTLLLAVKSSTETDNSCLEILLGILNQILPYAIRESLLSKMRKELAEKANTCRAVTVSSSRVIQQVPPGELSQEMVLHQSSLLGPFEDSIRQHAHACAEKKLLKERLKNKSEKCERLKDELRSLKGENQELASSTQRQVTACLEKIENLQKRIEQLEKTIEEQNMLTKRGRSIIVTKMGEMFVQLRRQSEREIQKREESLATALKENEELRLEMEAGRLTKVPASRKAGKTSKAKSGQRTASISQPSSSSIIPSVEIPADVIRQNHLLYLCSNLKSLSIKMVGSEHSEKALASHWSNVALQLGFTVPELEERFLGKLTSEFLLPAIDWIMSAWVRWNPGDKRGSTGYPRYSHLKQALLNTDLKNVGENLISYEELAKYKVQH